MAYLGAPPSATPPRPHGAIFNYNVLNFLATYRLGGSRESSYPIRGKYSIGQCHDSAPLATLHHNHYRPQAKLGQGNISRSIRHSVHREGKGGLSTGGSASGKSTSRGGHVSRGSAYRVSASMEVCLQGGLHPKDSTSRMVGRHLPPLRIRKAGGMNPTGMLSCFSCGIFNHKNTRKTGISSSQWAPL